MSSPRADSLRLCEVDLRSLPDDDDSDSDSAVVVAVVVVVVVVMVMSSGMTWSYPCSCWSLQLSASIVSRTRGSARRRFRSSWTFR